MENIEFSSDEKRIMLSALVKARSHDRKLMEDRTHAPEAIQYWTENVTAIESLIDKLLK